MESCEDCRFCILQDYGYSNYTVEGTQVICSKSLHPSGQFDRFYGEDPRLGQAEYCPAFEAGLSIKIDVEGDEYDLLSDEQKAIYGEKFSR